MSLAICLCRRRRRTQSQDTVASLWFVTNGSGRLGRHYWPALNPFALDPLQRHAGVNNVQFGIALHTSTNFNFNSHLFLNKFQHQNSNLSPPHGQILSTQTCHLKRLHRPSSLLASSTEVRCPWLACFISSHAILFLHFFRLDLSLARIFRLFAPLARSRFFPFMRPYSRPPKSWRLREQRLSACSSAWPYCAACHGAGGEVSIHRPEIHWM